MNGDERRKTVLAGNDANILEKEGRAGLKGRAAGFITIQNAEEKRVARDVEVETIPDGPCHLLEMFSV